ncbi:MAG: DUF222 domain-containing protein [Acidimicrobiaceae bacterium]|nr:DUF222 domain-containing protein [Acidimicrobiaceae bacterium]
MLRDAESGAKQARGNTARASRDTAHANGTAAGTSSARPANADASHATADVADASGAPKPASADAAGAGLAGSVGCGASWGVHGLRRLDAAELAGLCRGELEVVLGDIERVANRLAGYRAEVLGALDALNASGAGPDADVHQTLRDAAGVSGRDARRMARVAAKAREHDEVLVAMSDGDITPDQAEALCDARVPEAVRSDLVGAAVGEDTDATRRRIRRAEADHSVETSMERFERQRQARGAGWQRDHEGMLRLWAKFDPAAGAQIEAALEMLRREYWSDDKQVLSGRRTPAQRDADVLAYVLAGITATDADAAAVERLRARAQRPGGECCDRPTGGDGLGCEPRLAPAQVSVLIGLEALRGHIDEVGLTDAGTELPPEIVRKLACDAEIIPVILGGPGGPADVGRSRRTVPRRLRRLLIARDRHCRWPGCHAPPSRCDAHHIWHWAKGGPTNLDNLVLLCHRHHHHLHEHGYEMVPQPDGTWTVTHETEPDPTPQRDPAQARAP